MSQQRIAIGVITCKRPQGLSDLLESLAEQNLSSKNKELFSWFIVVVDNDLLGHNRTIVEKITAKYKLDIVFAEEATPGIPAARNKSITAAGNCDAFIFVDDDEKAPSGWLDAMLTLWHESGEDIITGPVHPILPKEVPVWAKKSRLFVKDYPYRRGQVLSRAFTNNTLVSRKVLQDLGASFDMRFQYSGSSDLHYFMRARRKGYKILWCPEAVIHETIPESRISFNWMLKRGFRVGSGETKTYLYINPGWKTVCGILYRATGRIAIGCLQLLLLPFTRWRGLVFGCRRIASGIGGISGLVGIDYQEYKNIHGQ